MTRHTLTAGHVRATLVLPQQADPRGARATGRMLPGGWDLTAHADAHGPPDIEVTVGAPGIAVDARTVFLRLPPRAVACHTLAYTTFTALERLRQQHQKLTLHATAVVSPAGQALMLLGAKAAGKTSTALALAARGWTHAGDDLITLAEEAPGRLAIWPGNPTAAVRDPHQPLVPKTPTALTPMATAPARLAWIVRLAVHPAIPAATLTPATPLSVNERLRLHEALARYISGLPTPLNGVDTAPYSPVWPLDTPALARWRHHLITLIDHHRFDYLHAPTPDAAAELLSQQAI